MRSSNAYRWVAPLALAGTLAWGSAQAEDAAESSAPGSTAAAPAAREALREEMREVLTRMVAAGALSEDAAGQAPLAVESPPDRVVSLGLVLDTASRSGPTVLAVTPGGNAQALGLRGGDRLLSLNGAALAGASAQFLREQTARVGSGGAVRFELERDGQRLSVGGVLRPLQVPGFRLEVGGSAGLASGASRALAAALPAAGSEASGCGRISHFPIAPRSDKLFKARIVLIDGTLPGPTGQDSYRVAAGPHEVTVAENIDYRDLPTTFSRERRQGGEKRFSVEVRPDTTVMVAARLLEHSEQPRIGGYWEPVAWKEIHEPCR
jgi:hypothetical protein